MEALSAFIQSQKTLLDQTLQDIARLQELRQNVVSNPDDALDLVTQQVRACVLEYVVVLKAEQASSITAPFSAQPAIVASGAQEIEWSAFNGCGMSFASSVCIVTKPNRPISVEGPRVFFARSAE